MSLITRALAPARRSAALASRSFASGIPSIEKHAVGRQLEEIEAEELGYDRFNRDALDTSEAQGNSKDDPILVPSFHTKRAVGISHNDSSYLYYFNLEKGKVHYLPAIEKYFLLYNPEELAQLVKEVESKQE